MIMDGYPSCVPAAWDGQKTHPQSCGDKGWRSPEKHLNRPTVPWQFFKIFFPESSRYACNAMSTAADVILHRLNNYSYIILIHTSTFFATIENFRFISQKCFAIHCPTWAAVGLFIEA